MIKGLDVGYSYTKDNDNRIFKSAYSYTDSSVLGCTQFTIDGVNYFIGRGNQTSEFDKTNSEMNKVCTIYDFYLTQGLNDGYNQDYKLVVGLPVSQYKDQKEKLHESIFNYNKSEVFVNGKQMKFSISDVLVVMQGVASLYTLGDLIGDYIIIDIGGLTLDISLVRFTSTSSELITCDTWYKGIRTLYSKVIECVNNHFHTQLDDSYAENILQTGTLYVDDEYKSCTFLKEFLHEYMRGIVESINVKYPYRTSSIVLTGGGSILMADGIRKFYPDKKISVINSPQYANAQGYYKIGCYKFGGK